MSNFLEWRKPIVDDVDGKRLSDDSQSVEFHKNVEQAISHAVADGITTYLNNKTAIPVFMRSWQDGNENGFSFSIGRSHRSLSDIVLSQRRFGHECKVVKIRYRDTFENIFAEMQKANFYIELCDDLKNLSYGFLVLRGDGCTIYRIRMHAIAEPPLENYRKIGLPVVREREDELEKHVEELSGTVKLAIQSLIKLSDEIAPP